MFSVGDFAYDLIRNEKVEILEKNEIWRFTTYKVYNLFSKEIYKLNSEQIGQDIARLNYDENYVRYMTVLGKVKDITSQGVLSYFSKDIIPLPHQLYVLNRVMSSNNIRYILADEVGLGKTIEAGMIIKELKTRGLVKRILVVCPKGLVTQWEREMEEKFGEKFHIILPSDYDTIRKLTGNDDIYGQFQQVISPMDSIKPLESRAGWSKERIDEYNEERIFSIVNAGWDLVIIDEAHRVAGSTGEVSRYKLGKLLAKSSPYLLLLTATPHSGKTEPFLRLIRLLDEDAFPNYKAIVKEQVAPFVIRNQKREAIDNEGNILFKNRITKIVEIQWDERHSMQKELYDMVTEYVRNGYNKAFKEKKYYIGFLMVLMQRLITSSTAAIIDTIERRIGILKSQKTKLNSLTFEDLIEADLEDKLSVILSETGIDKIADVLDNEMADIDFTQIYVNSIRNPKNIEHNISNLEEDLKKEIIKAKEYKELIREDKVLKANPDGHKTIELNKLLFKMCNSYSLWKEGRLFLGENIDINDEKVVKHLEQENYWSRGQKVPLVFIENFPNEKGYFSLWELSINDDIHTRRILPVFINDNMIYRPFAGDRIWDEFLKDDVIITVNDNVYISDETYNNILEISQGCAYDAFLELKEEYEKKHEEEHRKYSYALEIRIDAAKRIGIENIKRSRLKELEKEKDDISLEFEKKRTICPLFKPIFILRLE